MAINKFLTFLFFSIYVHSFSSHQEPHLYFNCLNSEIIEAHCKLIHGSLLHTSSSKPQINSQVQIFIARDDFATNKWAAPISLEHQYQSLGSISYLVFDCLFFSLFLNFMVARVFSKMSSNQPLYNITLGLHFQRAPIWQWNLKSYVWIKYLKSHRKRINIVYCIQVCDNN